MSDRVGVGIVGAGFAADLHARVYGSLGPGVELLGVASRDLEKAEAFARRAGIRSAFPDVDALLSQDDIHLVDLCIPNHRHKEYVVQAARAGKHVVCPKPLTGYFGDAGEDGPAGLTPRARMLQAALRNADEMIEAVERHGVFLMYAENWLYAPAIDKARRLVKESGGTIFELRAEESHHGSHAPYAKTWRSAGGGALLRLGAHPIAVVLHLKHCEGVWRTGTPITAHSVRAEVGRLTAIDSFRASDHPWVVQDWADVEDWAIAVITFTDGAKGVVLASDVCLGGIKATVDVFLSNARIHCNLSRTNALEAFAPDPQVFGNEYFVEKLETKAGWSFPSLAEDWALGYVAELADFVESARTGRAPLADGLLGREVLRVIYSAYLSAEQGRAVSLSRETA